MDYYETSQIIKALENMTEEQFERFNATDRDGYDTRESKYRHCRRCGQGGYEGAYPFSTYGGNICDDCGDY